MKDPLEALTHDIVTAASAGTYNAEELSKLGLLIEINLATHKTRFVGDPKDPLYPDIIVWKPNTLEPESGKGTAVIIEKIETKNSIDLNTPLWEKLAAIDVIFNLVVPKPDVDKVKKVLKERKIENVNLQSYVYDTEKNNYIFADEKGIR